MKINILLLLLIPALAYSVEFLDMPYNRQGEWKSTCIYNTPEGDLTQQTRYTVRLNKEEDQLVISGYCESQSGRDTTYSCVIELSENKEGLPPFLSTNSQGLKAEGSIEVINLNSFKFIFPDLGHQTTFSYRMKDKDAIEAEQTTFDMKGTKLSSAKIYASYISTGANQSK